MFLSRLKTAGSTVLVASMLIGGGAPAWAQVNGSMSTQLAGAGLFSRTAKAPEISSIPILTNIVKSGAKLYYIGERSGLFGWFIMKDGQIQIIYVTADGKTSLVGAMFTAEGENVSGAQIEALSAANKEVAEVMSASGTQQEQVSQIGSTAGGATSVPSSASNADGLSVGGLRGVALSPGERLVNDLRASAGVVLGNNDKAEILMVMDVNCRFCQETWKGLRDYVQSNRIQVRMVPITLDVKSDATRAAAKLLESKSAFETWDRYVGGDKAALDGKPDDIRVRAILANREMADRWNIKTTPYLVYRGQDGRIKIVQGEPKRVAAIVSDLLK